ncbi:methyltransferase RsmF C-terminal domain-like protein [Geoglobus sp.]
MDENEILEALKEQFGVEGLDFRLKVMGKNRIYAYRDCSLDVEEYHSGVYFGRIERDGIRLSIEGCYLLADQLKKNVVDVSFEEMVRWLRGDDLERSERGYVVLRWKSYYLGCGKGNGRRIRNFVPKDRRLR